jgi:hypothetical protein
MHHRTPGRRTARRTLLRLAAPCALLGCGGELTGVAGAPNGALASGRGTALAARLDPALLGRWRRVVLLQGADGGTTSAETTWSFTADGSALRTAVARSLTFGAVDAVSAAADWHVEGRTLVLVFRTPAGGVARVVYAVERRGGRDVLALDGQRFARVGG